MKRLRGHPLPLSTNDATKLIYSACRQGGRWRQAVLHLGAWGLIQKLKTEFDMVLIDTPPLLQVADARLICNQADATVLVIAQHTPRETAFLVSQQLADDGSYLLGTILNKWDPKTSLHGYADRGYYKRYYAEETSQ